MSFNFQRIMTENDKRTKMNVLNGQFNRKISIFRRLFEICYGTMRIQMAPQTVTLLKHDCDSFSSLSCYILQLKSKTAPSKKSTNIRNSYIIVQKFDFLFESKF